MTFSTMLNTMGVGMLRTCGIFGLTLAGLVLQDIYRKTLHK